MPYDVSAFRAQFPALTEGAAHFDGPGGTQVPTRVAQAVYDALTSAVANRGRVTAAERRAEGLVAEGRSALADLLGITADSHRIIVGRSMTSLTYEVSRALAKTWAPGDEVVVTRLDHDANVRPWVQAAAAVGAEVRWVDFEPGNGELPTAAVQAALSARTRLVAVTAAANLIGTRPDVPAIMAAAHRVGALGYVDGVHATAHAVVDVPGWGADFYACSPYKFLGPHCGVVAGRTEVLEALRPDKLLPSTEEVPERFELGTLPYEFFAGITETVEVLADIAPGGALGRRARLAASMAAVAEHEDGLRRRIEAGLADLGATVWSRARERTPTLLFRLPGVPDGVVRARLATRGVNAPCGSFYALECSRHLGLGDEGAVRVGLAPYNDDEDVDRLLDALADLR